MNYNLKHSEFKRRKKCSCEITHLSLEEVKTIRDALLVSTEEKLNGLCVQNHNKTLNEELLMNFISIYEYMNNSN